MFLNDIASFKDARVTIMGLGRNPEGSGASAARFCLRHGARVTITDLNSEDELRAQVESLRNYPDRVSDPIFVLGEHRETDFMSADLIVANPGVPRESKNLQIAREHNIPIESDVSLFFRFCPFPIIAVTGTRGKSTTTALIGEILKMQNPKTIVAGNILHSPLEDLDWLLLERLPEPIVLELSSWLVESLENISTAPHIAVLTNLYEDHLNRYKNFEAYALAKEQLFHNMKASDVAILNGAQERVRAVADRTQAQVVFFDATVLPIGEDEIKLKGKHNMENVRAAVAAVRAFGVCDEDIVKSLKSFAGLSNRQETIRKWKGITFVNDTTATSPDGTIAALERFFQSSLRVPAAQPLAVQAGTKQSFQKHIVLIAGGASKELSFVTMGEKIQETCKQVVLLEGGATDSLLFAIGSAVPSVRVDSMKKAVDEAVRVAKSGDIIILSPGCASFGMFKNEFDRGEQFVSTVRSLTAK